jgi:hypothetical protein
MSAFDGCLCYMSPSICTFHNRIKEAQKKSQREYREREARIEEAVEVQRRLNK